MGDPLRLPDGRRNVTAAPNFGIRSSALPAWRRLHQALADADRPAPCRSDPDAWCDPPDQEAAEYAANLCARCPVLELCGQFANANRETSGIWGGRSRVPTRGRPAATSKESA